MSENKEENDNKIEKDLLGPADEDADEEIEIRPGMEPMTPEEMEKFLARARVQGRSLTSEEQYAIFGPPKEAEEPEALYEDVEEMDAAVLEPNELAALEANFFPELDESTQHMGFGDSVDPTDNRLIHGVIFDFDNTLAHLTRPLDDLLEEGARQAEAYMRSTGMTLPENFWQNIMEARRFSEEKSEEEMEEHIADDAMSFLLQFFGYPASQMDPEVLGRAVDLFYAPEMTAWTPAPGAIEMLQQLQGDGYKLALLTNYNCDRVFQRTIDYLGIRPYLDVVIASATVEYRKPDEKLFQLVLDRWEVLPYEVIMVGDSLSHDIQGAIELGALTVQSLQPTTPQVEHDNAQVAEQVKADATLTHLSQLPALVTQWAR